MHFSNGRLLFHCKKYQLNGAACYGDFISNYYWYVIICHSKKKNFFKKTLKVKEQPPREIYFCVQQTRLQPQCEAYANVYIHSLEFQLLSYYLLICMMCISDKSFLKTTVSVYIVYIFSRYSFLCGSGHLCVLTAKRMWSQVLHILKRCCDQISDHMEDTLGVTAPYICADYL